MLKEDRELYELKWEWSRRPWPALTRWVAVLTAVAAALALGPSRAWSAAVLGTLVLAWIALVRRHARLAVVLLSAGGVVVLLGKFLAPRTLFDAYGMGLLVPSVLSLVWLWRHRLVQEEGESDDEFARRQQVDAFANPHPWDRHYRRAHIFSFLSWPALIFSVFALTSPRAAASPLTILMSLPATYLYFRGFYSDDVTQTNFKRHSLQNRPDPMRDRARGLAEALGMQPSTARKTRFTRNDGLILGRLDGREIGASFEESILVIGPPRSGKSSSIIIPLCVEAPGPVLVTSIRPDVVRNTTPLRKQIGPVVAFDPLGLASAVENVEPLKWSPVSGCEEEAVAIRRGEAMMGAVGMAGTSNGDFWESAGADLLAPCLHSAALSGGGTKALQGYLQSQSALQAAVQVLRAHNSPMADTLDGWVRNNAGQTVGSALATAKQALAALKIPEVRQMCQGGELTPLDQLLASRATIHLLTKASQTSLGALFAAFLADLLDIAERTASTRLDGRLDPPLELLLDEAANIAPIATLPVIMATGGGSGIVVLTVLQSLAQARARWGDAGANALLDAANWKVILPGISHYQDLSDLAALAGMQDVERISSTSGAGGTSTTSSWERRPVLDPNQLRELPEWHAYVLARSYPPAICELIPWWDRTWGK